jgi:hypothetical protein
MQEEKPDVFPSSNPEGNDKISKIEQMNALMRKNREAKKSNAEVLSPEPTQNNVVSGNLVEPDFGSEFDVIPLPSKGLLYSSKVGSLKVSYMNAGDENILTNPNLLRSGKFLEVLMTRKILDTTIKYQDLLVGDRDAIMIWLRSTGYGNKYPISLIDPNTGDEFETEIDLNDIKFKTLSAEPDEEGLFDYVLTNGSRLKFKLLNVGELSELEKYADEAENSENYDLATYSLSKQIVEVDGNRDREFINDFVKKMRILESRNLKKFISEIEPGMDLKIKVQTPGGGQIETFFPLNPSFFWPDI